jgi:predicted HTH transcriptional regulator
MLKSEVPINQRIAELIEKYAQGKQRRFAEAIGVSPSMISDLYGKRQNKPGLEMLQKIGITYPEISMDWLVSGEEPMIRDGARHLYGVDTPARSQKLLQEINTALYRKENKEKIGSRLAVLREYYKLSRHDVANMCAIPERELEKYENGIIFPQGNILYDLANLYKLDIDAFTTYVILGIDSDNHELSIEELVKNTIDLSEKSIDKYIYQDLSIDEVIKPGILNKVRSLVGQFHPWQTMTDEHLIRSAGLWQEDRQTNKRGLTLAAVLLLGKDEVIRSIAPDYRVEVLTSIPNSDNFQIKQTLQTNLIDTYDELMSIFNDYLNSNVKNTHLNRLYRGGITIALREAMKNSIVHRDYISSIPTQIVFYHDKIEFLNPNRPMKYNDFSKDAFIQESKNPTIARFFRQIGKMEEKGFGLYYIMGYVQDYSFEVAPEFYDNKQFSVTIPLPAW